MTKYKLITLHRMNGPPNIVRQFKAGSDQEALQLAAEWREGAAAELWRTYRVIRRWARD